MKATIRHDERVGALHFYEASIGLPSRISLAELDEALHELQRALRAHTPDMVTGDGPHTLEIAPGGFSLVLSTVGHSLRPPCVHLADSDRPSEALSPEPCELCGRYVADD